MFRSHTLLLDSTFCEIRIEKNCTGKVRNYDINKERINSARYPSMNLLRLPAFDNNDLGFITYIIKEFVYFRGFMEYIFCLTDKSKLKSV